MSFVGRREKTDLIPCQSDNHGVSSKLDIEERRNSYIPRGVILEVSSSDQS